MCVSLGLYMLPTKLQTLKRWREAVGGTEVTANRMDRWLRLNCWCKSCVPRRPLTWELKEPILPGCSKLSCSTHPTLLLLPTAKHIKDHSQLEKYFAEFIQRPVQKGHRFPRESAGDYRRESSRPYLRQAIVRFFLKRKAWPTSSWTEAELLKQAVQQQQAVYF